MATEVEAASFETLPNALTLRILAMFPSDERARCSAVRRAWHDLLKDPAAWTRLDLSPRGGVTCKASAEELLLGAAAKARGVLAFLDVSGRDELRVETLLQVVAENAVTLRELRATVRRGACLGRVARVPRFCHLTAYASRSWCRWTPDSPTMTQRTAA